jgi:LPS sulfotransferase NodH
MSTASQDSAGTRWFVVVGARRTGTNILREILNTNDQIAMLGEVFTPSPAPAQWANFLTYATSRKVPPSNAAEATSLLDEYFEFVEYRVRNHWRDKRKSASQTVGVDIKYDQLWQIAPTDQAPGAPPFLLGYFQRHRILLIHTIRENVIKCAISEMIAQQRNFWHNYDGAVVDRGYHVDAGDCLSRARQIVRQRAEFERLARGCLLIEVNYEQLAAAIDGALQGQIAEYAIPFKHIAKALRVPCRFSYDGRLRRAINVPYSRVITNHAELRRAVAGSEFYPFAESLD